jgi:hypothetical protein
VGGDRADGPSNFKMDRCITALDDWTSGIAIWSSGSDFGQLKQRLVVNQRFSETFAPASDLLRSAGDNSSLLWFTTLAWCVLGADGLKACRCPLRQHDSIFPCGGRSVVASEDLERVIQEYLLLVLRDPESTQEREVSAHVGTRHVILGVCLPRWLNRNDTPVSSSRTVHRCSVPGIRSNNPLPALGPQRGVQGDYLRRIGRTSAGPPPCPDAPPSAGPHYRHEHPPERHTLLHPVHPAVAAPTSRRGRVGVGGRPRQPPAPPGGRPPVRPGAVRACRCLQRPPAYSD